MLVVWDIIHTYIHVNKLEFSCAKLIAKHPLPVKNVRKITQKWKQIWSWWPLWGFLKFHHGQPVNLAEITGALLPTRYSLFLSIFPVFDIRNWSRARAGQGSCSGSSDWNNFHEYSNVNTCRSTAGLHQSPQFAKMSQSLTHWKYYDTWYRTMIISKVDSAIKKINVHPWELAAGKHRDDWASDGGRSVVTSVSWYIQESRWK